jgi:hypothetical protein
MSNSYRLGFFVRDFPRTSKSFRLRVEERRAPKGGRFSPISGVLLSLLSVFGAKAEERSSEHIP